MVYETERERERGREGEGYNTDTEQNRQRGKVSLARCSVDTFSLSAQSTIKVVHYQLFSLQLLRDNETKYYIL